MTYLRRVLILNLTRQQVIQQGFCYSKCMQYQTKVDPDILWQSLNSLCVIIFKPKLTLNNLQIWYSFISPLLTSLSQRFTRSLVPNMCACARTHTRLLLYIISVSKQDLETNSIQHTVTLRPIASHWLQSKQLYNSHCYNGRYVSCAVLAEML